MKNVLNINFDNHEQKEAFKAKVKSKGWTTIKAFALDVLEDKVQRKTQ